MSLTDGEHFKAKQPLCFPLSGECQQDGHLDLSLRDSFEEVLYSTDPSDGQATSLVPWQVFLPLRKETDSIVFLPAFMALHSLERIR